MTELTTATYIIITLAVMMLLFEKLNMNNSHVKKWHGVICTVLFIIGFVLVCFISVFNILNIYGLV